MSASGRLASARARANDSAPPSRTPDEQRQSPAARGVGTLRKELRARLNARNPRSKHGAPRCGARCQDGHACRGPVVPGRKRCYHHGGLSTGPKTPEGKARCTANLPHQSKRTDPLTPPKDPTS